jgi:hypothetical protein
MYNRKAVDEFVTFIQAANGIADKSALHNSSRRTYS